MNQSAISIPARTWAIDFVRRTMDLARRAAARAACMPDPLLHPIRRRRAAAGLPTRISEVMIICYGNICRSPFAAAALARELGDNGTRVRSAGFFGPDRPSPDAALAAAQQRQFDLKPHRSSLMSTELARSADLIVVMERSHARQLQLQHRIERRRIVLLGDFDPDPIVTRAVPDPYGNDATVFDACYGRIERCVGGLAAAMRAAGAGPVQIQPRAR